MKTAKNKFFCLLFLSLSLVSCSQSLGRQHRRIVSQKEIDFNNYIQVWDINTRLHIMLYDQPYFENTLKYCEPIHLRLENHSGKNIGSKDSHNAQILKYEKGEWMAIENLMSYSSPEEVYLSPTTRNSIEFSAFPDICDPEDATEIRVFVIGTIYDGEKPTNEQVAAYIDVTLEP
jgi:hypothetical protein